MDIRPRITPPTDTKQPNRGACRVLAASAACLVLAAVSSGVSSAVAAPDTVPLGTAESFAVLGHSTVTNTGSSVITGNLGVTPGSSIVGFPPGTVEDGSTHIADAVAEQAQQDASTSYTEASNRPVTAGLTGQDLGGLTLVGGVYAFDTSAQLTGMLTLNGQNDPDTVFVIKTGSTLVTASNSSVLLVNGAQACNVYWRVGSSATFGTLTDFVGTVVADQSVTANTSAIFDGRLIGLNGAVTLDSNVVNPSPCSDPVDEDPVDEDPVDEDPVDDPSDDGPDGVPGSGGPRENTPTPPATPVIPHGHPETGLGGAADAHR